MADVDDPEDTVLHLPAEPSSVAEARAFVDDTVRRWGLQPPDTLPLLTSEVVTNAVVHTDAGWVVVRARRSEGRVRVEVADQESSMPVVRVPDPTTPGGFGMWLVEQLARAWGVEDVADDGKIVWFEVALSTAA